MFGKNSSSLRPVSNLAGSTESYESEKDFLSDLQRVLEEDYGTTLIGDGLREAGRNINQFLGTFL